MRASSGSKDAELKTQNPQNANRLLPSEQVPHFHPLSLEVPCIVGVSQSFDGELLDNSETVSFETYDLFRVIGKEPDVADSEVE